jgi:hypothetical protein
VDYLTLADMRRVSDARSRATVQEAYGVSKRQVYRWLREAGPLSDRSVALEQRFRSRGPAVDEASVVRVTRQMMKFSARGIANPGQTSASLDDCLRKRPPYPRVS